MRSVIGSKSVSYSREYLTIGDIHLSTSAVKAGMASTGWIGKLFLFQGLLIHLLKGFILLQIYCVAAFFGLLISWLPGQPPQQ